MIIVDALIFLDFVKTKVIALNNVKNALKKRGDPATAIAFVINAFSLRIKMLILAVYISKKTSSATLFFFKEKIWARF